MGVNNNKSGKNQCSPSSAEGCACSFSYNNDNSSWSPSSPPPPILPLMEDAWLRLGAICVDPHMTHKWTRDWWKQHCGAQHNIIIEKGKYGKIKVLIAGTGLVHIPWLARCNNFFCPRLYRAVLTARSHCLCPRQTFAPGDYFFPLAELEERGERVSRCVSSLKNRLE